MATTKQFVRRPYPNMYEFLIDDFAEHTAKAFRANTAHDPKGFVEELKKAQMALDDFLLLINELPPKRSREFWALQR